jgi:hypothetical protein
MGAKVGKWVMIFAQSRANLCSLANFGAKAELNLSAHSVKGDESGNRLPCGKVVRDTFISVLGLHLGKFLSAEQLINIWYKRE